MKITRRDQILLLGMVVIIAAFVFFRFSYMPAKDEIESLSITRQELQQEKEHLQKMAKKAPDIRKDLEEKYANLNKRLPSEDELVPLLNILNNSCNKYAIPFNSLEYRGAAEVSTSGAQILVFTVGTKGKITQLFDFLNTLETNQRLISVLDVSLTALRAESESETASAEDNTPPVYYIAPPGMPEAKLQRVKFEVEDSSEDGGSASSSNAPMSASFVPDSFEMSITINAYYTGQSISSQVAKEGDKTGTNKATTNNKQTDKENKATKGEV